MTLGINANMQSQIHEFQLSAFIFNCECDLHSNSGWKNCYCRYYPTGCGCGDHKKIDHDHSVVVTAPQVKGVRTVFMSIGADIQLVNYNNCGTQTEGRR